MSSDLALAAPMSSARSVRPAWLRALIALVSFECLFVLFLYSNALKLIFGIRPPIDETVLLAGLTTLAGAIVVLRQGIPLRSLAPPVAFLLFLGWVVISTGWSPARILAREYLQHFLLFDLFPLLAASLILAADRRRIERFLLLAGLLSLIIAIVGNILYFQHGSFWKATDEWEGRAYNTLGYTVAFGTVTWLGLAAFSRFGSRRQLLAMLALLFCFFFLAVSGSRRSFLLVVAAAIAILLLTGIGLGRRRITLSVAQIAAFFVALFGVGVIIVAYAQGLRLETLDRLLSLFNKLETDAIILEANRIDYWKGAVRAFIEAPLFGHGLAGFNIYMRGAENYGSHPHNILLEILANFGLVGLLLFVPVLLVGPGRLSLRRSDGTIDPLAIVVGTLFLSTFAMSFINTALADQPLLFTSIGLTLLPRDKGATRRVMLSGIMAAHPAFARGATVAPTVRPLS